MLFRQRLPKKRNILHGSFHNSIFNNILLALQIQNKNAHVKPYLW